MATDMHWCSMKTRNRTSLQHDAGPAGRDRGRRGPFGPWLAAAILLVVAGCGDSGDAQPVDNFAATAAPQPNQPAGKPGAGKEAGLRFHTKIDDVLGEEQAQRLRHKFSGDDFGPSIGNDARRDPFRSLAAAQLAAAAEQENRPTDPAQACKEVVAPDSSVRDLRLVGIVLRGSRSYALFLDKASKGQIVTKGDCLGVEKARVTSVRAGFVTLQITPEVVPGGPESQLQERTIALYPDEIPVDGEMP
jgi:Tfp pilus assembly protein PilP